MLGYGAQHAGPAPRKHAWKEGNRPFSTVPCVNQRRTARVGVTGGPVPAALPHSMPGREGVSLLPPCRAQGGVAGHVIGTNSLVASSSSHAILVSIWPRGVLGQLLCCVAVASTLTGLSDCPRRQPHADPRPPLASCPRRLRAMGTGCCFPALDRVHGTMCIYLMRPT